jgi:hypothetical protein
VDEKFDSVVDEKSKELIYKANVNMSVVVDNLKWVDLQVEMKANNCRNRSDVVNYLLAKARSGD